VHVAGADLEDEEHVDPAQRDREIEVQDRPGLTSRVHLLTVSRFVLLCEGWRRRRDSERCNMVSSGPDGVCEGVNPR
jgi:hypothetical protein